MKKIDLKLSVSLALIILFLLISFTVKNVISDNLLTSLAVILGAHALGRSQSTNLSKQKIISNEDTYLGFPGEKSHLNDNEKND